MVKDYAVHLCGVFKFIFLGRCSIFMATAELHGMSSAADPVVHMVQVVEAEATAPLVLSGCIRWIPQVLYDVMTT